MIMLFQSTCLMQIKLGGVRWKATGKFDLRGLRGQEGATAKFQVKVPLSWSAACSAGLVFR